VAEIEAELARNPELVLIEDKKPIGGKELRERIASVKAGLADSEDNLLGQLGPWLRWMAVAAMLAGLAGLAAAVAGALGLRGAARAGRDALKSREVLIASFAQWQQRLPRHLGLILGLSALGLSLVAALELVFGLSRAGHGLSGGEIKLRLMWLVMLLMLAWAAVSAYLRMRSAFAPYEAEPSEVLGRLVSPAQAPGLWQTVLDLAHQTGATPPVQIVVGAVDCFYVTGGGIRLMPSGQLLTGQTLYMPITCLSLLQDQEVRAIVAHELAQFAGADTLYSQRFAPLYRGFVLRLQALANEGNKDGKTSISILPALNFAGHLLEQFHLAVMHWSRQREFAADALAARVTDAGAIASSLLRVSGVDSQVSQALRLIAKSPATDGGTAPLSWRDALLQSRPAGADGQGASSDGQGSDGHEQFAVSHPTDTHPSTPERIQAVGLSLDAVMIERNRQRALNDEPQPLGVWFSQPDALEAEILAEFRQTAQTHRAEALEQLSAIVNAATGLDISVYEAKGWGIWMMAFLAVVFVSVVPVVSLLADRQESPFGAVFAWCMAIAGVFVWGCVWLHQRSQHPVMHVGESGLLAHGMAREVAWSEFLDWNVSKYSSTYTFVFTLSSSAPPNQRLHRNWLRLTYKPKKSTISIAMGSPQGMSAESVSQHIASHLRALAAKQMLAQLDE
jgi:Zn-dependent protease with chaperone function